MKELNADMTDDGDIRIKSLTPAQLSVVVVTKLSTMERQLDDISNRLATKEDVRAVNNRIDAVKRTADENNAWIKRRTVELEAERNSFAGKLRARFGEYAVTIVIALLVASLVGGILFYIGHSDEAEEVQSEVRTLKELAP